MSLNDSVVTAFNELRTSFIWSSQWISDGEWTNFLQTEKGLSKLTVRQFNTALTTHPQWGNILLSEEKNKYGVYRQIRFIKKITGDKSESTNARCYYIAKGDEIPHCPSVNIGTKAWQGFYDNNTIGKRTRKRKNDDDETRSTQRPNVTPGGRTPTATETSQRISNLETVQRQIVSVAELVGIFGEDKKVKKLLTSTSPAILQGRPIAI